MLIFIGFYCIVVLIASIIYKVSPGETIVNTTEDDLDTVYRIFDEAVQYQKRNNYPDWENYDKDVFKDDIRNQLHYKIVIDQHYIACVFSIRLTDKIIWRERDMDDAIYLHRIAVNPAFKGQRQFQKILDWSIEYAKQLGRQFIRMDTWANNPKIIEYYKGFGFVFLENFTTPDTEELPKHNRKLTLALLEYKIR